MTEETKHDLLLKRVQITIAILAGITTLMIGVYNVKKNIFEKSGTGQIELTVKSDQGGNVPSARVEIYNTQNALIAASQTDGEGVFKRESLDAASYLLKVSARGFEPEAATVQVNSKRTTSLDISLRPISAPAQDFSSSTSSDRPAPTKIQSALEDVGASWIKKLTAGGDAPKSDNSTKSAPSDISQAGT